MLVKIKIIKYILFGTLVVPVYGKIRLYVHLIFVGTIATQYHQNSQLNFKIKKSLFRLRPNSFFCLVHM